MALAI